MKFFIFLLLSLTSCRTSTPPVIEVCILSPLGGGDCVESDGTKVFKTPSQMGDYWCTNESDEAKWSSWAYDAPIDAVSAQMVSIKRNARQ